MNGIPIGGATGILYADCYGNRSYITTADPWTMQAFFEVIIRCIFEVVFEIGLRLPGAVICKCLLRNSDIAFDSFQVIFFGIAFWSMIALGGWMICG